MGKRREYVKGELIGDQCIFIEELESIKKQRKGLFKCRCGKEFIAYINNVTRGNHTTSCGCVAKTSRSKRSKTHGQTGSITYLSWQGAKARCLDANNNRFNSHGNRGIHICDRWLNSFENFLEDMGERKSSKYSLDRVNNSKGYFKENCRWATAKEQANNTRRNRIIEHNGLSLTMVQWSEKMNISQYTLRARLDSGWQIERALFTPTRKHTYHNKINT